jgi:hypothetical protein
MQLAFACHETAQSRVPNLHVAGKYADSLGVNRIQIRLRQQLK